MVVGLETAALAAIASPRRREILRVVWREERAAGEIHRAKAPEGWEVLVPRRIAAREIHRVRRLPQVLGWRYWPEAHGRPPCTCDWCQRGQFGGRKIRARAARATS